MQENKNAIVGLLLIFILMFAWTYVNKPDELTQKENEAKVAAEAAKQNNQSTTTAPATTVVTAPVVLSPTENTQLLNSKFGAFANAASGSEQTEVIENDFIKITFTNKGGRIKEVFLKKYQKSYNDDKNIEQRGPLSLLEDSKNKFEYYLPVNGVGNVNTNDLYFTPTKSGSTISFRAAAGDGKYFEQKYSLSGDYNLNYDIRLEGLQDVLVRDQNTIRLNWQNYLDKLERNQAYERTYSTVYFKEVDKNSDYCNCRNTTANAVEKPVRWVSGTNQFFNTTLIAANTPFANAIVQTEMKTDAEEDLKRIGSEINIPFNHSASETFNMMIYSGPNEYNRLSEYKLDVQDIIPFGSSIFGTINRWIIRPLFNFLALFIGSKGFVILVLTLIVKAVLFPLSFGMIKSQSRMTALKPQIDKLKAKHGEDQQKMSMETMKLYQTYGVNPVGGCMPMLLQMPIWLALYRFFPAAIEFRQQSFLWATDLTSYDDLLKFGFDIPFFGHHISLFTMLWVISTLAYTWYNSRNMDFSANPAMGYMQYMMPIMFMFAFNTYASGLTCYLVFSNFLNIAQTLVTRNYLIDQNKVLAELEASKNKPKKPGGGFGERIRTVMEAQQKAQEERAKLGKK